MRARGDVEVGGPTVEDLEQQVGQVEVHDPVIGRCARRLSPSSVLQPSS
jgi:hypothetical protein